MHCKHSHMAAKGVHQAWGNRDKLSEDKSTISTRDKWKITVRDWGEKIQLLQKEWSHPGTRCFAMGSPSFELFKDCLERPQQIYWLLSCIYNEESSAVTALEQPTCPPSLVCSLIWSHFPPHIQDSTIWEQNREASAVERGGTFSATEAEQGRSSFSSTPKILFPF